MKSRKPSSNPQPASPKPKPPEPAAAKRSGHASVTKAGIDLIESNRQPRTLAQEHGPV